MKKLKKIKLIFISIFILFINDIHSQSLSQEYKQNEQSEQRLIEKGEYYKKIAKIWRCERREQDVYRTHVYYYYLITVNNKAYVDGKNIMNEYSSRSIALEVDRWTTYREKNNIIEFSVRINSIAENYKVELNLNTLEMYTKNSNNTINVYRCRENI
jgi:hypothetical protein